MLNIHVLAFSIFNIAQTIRLLRVNNNMFISPCKEFLIPLPPNQIIVAHKNMQAEKFYVFMCLSGIDSA